MEEKCKKKHVQFTWNQLFFVIIFFLGIICAILLRNVVTPILFGGKTFEGRSLIIKICLLLIYSTSCWLVFGVIFILFGRQLIKDWTYSKPVTFNFKLNIKTIADNFKKSLYTTMKFFTSHKELTLLLFFSFILRLFLANQNSYWLDELYSVKLFGLDRSNSADIIKYTAQNDSMHPPLYQLVLVTWMKFFGSGEISTRMLSTLYVTFAVLFVYLLVNRIYNKRVAFMASIFFSLSYIAIYYSLETRSYAQTLFLGSLSSLLLINYTDSLKDSFSWKSLFINSHFLKLSIVNIALQFTHLYNFFFLAVQSLFLFIFLVSQSRKKEIFNLLIKVSNLYILQTLPFVLLWAPVIIKNPAGYSGQIEVLSMPKITPINLLAEKIIRPNFPTNFGFYFAIFAIIILIIGTFINSLQSVVKKRDKKTTLFNLYLIMMTIIPPILFYLAWFFISPDRNSNRYFCVFTPILMMIIAVGVEQGRFLIFEIIKSFRLEIFLFNKKTKHFSILFTLAFVIISVLPGGLEAATSVKPDNRSISADITSFITRNDANKYYLIETAFRREPLLDYYLEQLNPQIYIHDTIQRYEETRLQENSEEDLPHFLNNENKFNNFDYIIVIFSNHTVYDFPKILNFLSENFTLNHEEIDIDGRGFIVYKID